MADAANIVDLESRRSKRAPMAPWKKWGAILALAIPAITTLNHLGFVTLPWERSADAEKAHAALQKQIDVLSAKLDDLPERIAKAIKEK